ncbi:putative septation protein SUN4 precursor [Podospora aff. communis PSN243]|uniref:Septation protein SUN4 n=1 Tax=Podospora aff. communis PSN243 TaxID=3040156 RepID=A0AAV9GMC0_9PEZI|nr:putative septation protein SUN4 precursor [Podospora aff. communis PSN243]
MKGIAGLAIVASFVAGVVAEPHNHGHNHQHLHRRNRQQADSLVEKRAKKVVYVQEVVEGPTVVEYVLGGQKVDQKKAEEGIKKGLYVVKGKSTPSFSAPPPSYSTSAASPDGGQFFEANKHSATSSSAPPPEPSQAAPAVPQGQGVDSEFPSGKVPCSKVPTEYGAIPIPWEKDNLGWTTLMRVGKYMKGAVFDHIEQPKGTGCEPGIMCSYACPPGYQKTQWPDEQGATGQSVGGLYCNSDGFLELTRPNHKKLCEPGAGGIFVRNELSKNAAVCRTDYPGNEAMTIPVDTQPGQTYPLTNPVSSQYYVWQGKKTTAQYYVNNEGVSVEQACTWDSSEFPDSAGNWAPINIGVGKADDGITYVSIFPNLPTTRAILNFNIEIEGTYSGECWFRNGQYAVSDKGCTIGVKEGDTATFVFKH